MINRSLTPDAAKVTLRIDLVKPQDRSIVGVDKTGARIEASYRDVGAAFRIPAGGEVWTAVRHGWVWFLDQRLDSIDEHDAMSANMQPGDTRLHAKGTVHMLAQAISVNGNPTGATMLDTFVTTLDQAISKNYVLSAIPVHDHTISVFHGASFLHQGVDYTVAYIDATDTNPAYAQVHLTGATALNDKVSVYYQRV